MLTKVLLPERDACAARRGGRREAPDRRCGAQVGLRGSDAAPRPRPPLARAHGPADGLRRLGGPDAGASRACSSSRRRSSPRCAPRAASPRQLAFESSARYGYPAGLPRPLLREAPLPLRAARARRPLHVPRAGPRRRRARRGARAPLRRPPGRRSDHGRDRAPAAILEKALAGERIDDAEALALLESRDLIAVGRAANELRARRTDPTGSPSSSTGTSTTRTSASPTATSAPSTAGPATGARATCCRSR